MSTEIGSLQASLSLDIRSFTEGINEATQVVRSLGATLKSALGNDSQGFSSLLKDASALKEEIKLLSSEMKSLNAEMARASAPAAFTEIATHTSRLKGDLEGAASGAAKLADAARQAETAMSGVGDEANDAYSVVDMLTGEVMSMTPTLTGAVGEMNRLAAEARNAAMGMDNAEGEGQSLYGVINSATGEVEQLAGDLRDAAQAMSRVGDEAAQAAGSTDRIGREAEGADKSTKKVAASMRNADKQASKMANNLNRSRTFADDLKRIVGGIVISQAFYSLVGIMEDLVRGAVKFANNMDQSAIAFKYLLGDATQANIMIRDMQDFAIHSPLDTTAVMDGTRKLMAMGFQAKSVIPTMQVLADTSAVFTSEASDMSDMIDHIVLALGQMKSSGKVMTQELRQLYNAGIPVFQILQEELGLTAEQVRNIGKQGIDSGLGVMAILKGLQKRYAGAAKEFTKTIPGALQVIKDSIFVLWQMFSLKPHNAFKEWLNEVAAAFEAFVMITRAYGLGGLLQAVFPPELHDSIRNIIGAFSELGKALKIVGNIVKDILGQAFSYLAQIFGWVLPPIFTFVHALAQIIQWVYTTIPFVRELAGALTALLVVFLVVRAFQGLWTLLKLGKLVHWFALGLKGLCKWFLNAAKSVGTFIAANWKLLLVLGAVVAMMALLYNFSDRARASMNKIADAFKKIDLGFNTDDIAQPEFKPEEPSEYDGELKDVLGSVTDIGDAADKTGKKLKKAFNQSFDEVFLIDPSQDDSLSGLNDFDVSAMMGELDALQSKMDELALSGDFWKDWGNIQDFAGFGGFTSAFDDLLGSVNEFWPALVDAFSAPEWVGLGIGAGIGALIGGLIGGPGGAIIGGAIGALAGYVVGLFWPEIKEAFESVGLSESHALGLAIGTPLGAAIGWLVGGPLGALVGGGIGALVGYIYGEIMQGLETGDWTGIATPIGTGLGAGIGFLVGGPLGALIGGAIGALVGAIVDMFIDGFTNGDWNEQGLGAAIGGGIGAAIGMCIGGPAGAAIGAAVGALVGWLVGLIVENWDAITGWFGDVGKAIGDFFVGVWDWIVEAWNGMTAAIGDFFGGLWNSISGFFSNIWNGIVDFFSNLWAGISDFFRPITDALANLGDVIWGILTDIWNGITTVFWDIFNGISYVLGEIWNVIVEIFSFIFDFIVMIGEKIWTAVSEFFTGIWNSVSKWFSDIWTSFTTWLSDIWTSFTTWLSDVWTKFTTWLAELFEPLVTWFSDVWNKFTTWLSDLWNSITGWFSDVFNKIGEFFGNIFNKIGEFFSNIWNKITGFFSDVWNKITGFFSDIFTSIRDWIADVINSFANFLSDLWNNIKNGIANIYDSFKNWLKDIWDNIFGKFFGWIGDGIQKLREFFGMSKKAEAEVDLTTNETKNVETKASRSADLNSFARGIQTNLGKVTPMNGMPIDGHKTGGVFNKEHVAWLNEGDTTEAVIPLDNETAMAPFANSVSKGVIEALAPFLAMQKNNSESLPPVYVGTLIADEKGLKELERKLNLIRVKEGRRGS